MALLRLHVPGGGPIERGDGVEKNLAQLPASRHRTTDGLPQHARERMLLDGDKVVEVPQGIADQPNCLRVRSLRRFEIHRLPVTVSRRLWPRLGPDSAQKPFSQTRSGRRVAAERWHEPRRTSRGAQTMAIED